ncbi:hypothetical protein ABPG75_000906 [Micractinium tetrahymenae]
MVTKSVLSRKLLRLTDEELHLLGWDGVVDEDGLPPPLLVTPADRSGDSGSWRVELGLGTHGRDGRLVKTGACGQLMAQLQLRPGDELRLSPAAAAHSGSGGTSGGGLICAAASVIERYVAGEFLPKLERQQQSPAEPLCTHCGAIESCVWRRHLGTKRTLCDRCYRFVLKHDGRLPGHVAQQAQQQRQQQEVAPEAAGTVGRHRRKSSAPQRVGPPPVSVVAPAQENAAPAQAVAAVRAAGPGAGAAGAVVLAAPASSGAPAAALLAPDAEWAQMYARLIQLLIECGVEPGPAQHYKFTLLRMEADLRRSNFLEIQPLLNISLPSITDLPTKLQPLLSLPDLSSLINLPTDLEPLLNLPDLTPLANLPGQFSGLQTSVGQLLPVEDNLVNLATSMTNLTNNLTPLLTAKDSLLGLGSTVGTLQSSLSGLQTSLSSVQGQVTTVVNNIGAVSISTLGSTVSSLSGTVITLSGTVTANFNTLTSSINSLKSSIQPLLDKSAQLLSLANSSTQLLALVGGGFGRRHVLVRWRGARGCCDHALERAGQPLLPLAAMHRRDSCTQQVLSSFPLPPRLPASLPTYLPRQPFQTCIRSKLCLHPPSCWAKLWPQPPLPPSLDCTSVHWMDCDCLHFNNKPHAVFSCAFLIIFLWNSIMLYSA